MPRGRSADWKCDERVNCSPWRGTVSSLRVQSCNLRGHSCGERDYATRPQLLFGRINGTSGGQTHCVAFPTIFPRRSSSASVCSCVYLCSLSFPGKTFASFRVSLHSRHRSDMYICESFNFLFHFFKCMYRREK